MTVEVVVVSLANIAVPCGTTHVALVGGRVAVIRVAQPGDADRVRALHEACDPHTVRERYLGAPPRFTPADLATLISPPGGCALVACAGRVDGELLGMAQVAGGLPVAEIAVLVRDDHQGRGLGTILARRAMDAAIDLNYQEMVAFGSAGNGGLCRLLVRLGLRGYARYDGSMLTLRAPLVAAAPAGWAELERRLAIH
jgi:GNAT superfamily N-acetyltransferase